MWLEMLMLFIRDSFRPDLSKSILSLIIERHPKGLSFPTCLRSQCNYSLEFIISGYAWCLKSKCKMNSYIRYYMSIFLVLAVDGLLTYNLLAHEWHSLSYKCLTNDIFKLCIEMHYWNGIFKCYCTEFSIIFWVLKIVLLKVSLFFGQGNLYISKHWWEVNNKKALWN